VKKFKSLGASLTKSVELSEQELIDFFQIEINEVGLWQCLVANHKGLANSGEPSESLRAYMARIAFLAK
jgi:hypothetical protein